jgi:TonB family protein
VAEFFTIENRRFSVSFITIVILHGVILWTLNRAALIEKDTVKLITDVELIKVVPDNIFTAAETAPASKSLWSRIKSALPNSNDNEGGDGNTPLAPALSRPAMPPPPQSMASQMNQESLQQQRDEKIKELADISGATPQKIAQMVQQEQALVERSEPIARRSAAPVLPQTEEVGTHRVNSLSDIQSQAVAKKTDTLQDTIAPSQLVERKQSLKRQLASLGSGQELRAENTAALKGSNQIKEIVGTMKERQKAQEIAALQKLIEAEGTSSAASGKVGSGAGGFGNGHITTAAKATALRFEEPSDIAVRKPVSPPPEPLSVRRSASAAAPAEVKKAAPVEISGPIGKRQVVSSSYPAYPEWAKKRGIEADVSLRFYVNPEGIVTDSISVIRTSGYRDIDASCVEHLKKWVFAPLSINEPRQDQWGIITIRFRLQ